MAEKTIKQIQVRLHRDEPGQTRETMTWLTLDDCPPEGAIIDYRRLPWLLKRRYSVREVSV